MSAGIGCLGQVVFVANAETVRTFEGFSRSMRAVYADHQVAGGKPASEFTGLNLDEVSFTMELNATLGISPDDEVRRLEDMMKAGEAHILLIGNRPKGYFTIRELGEAVRHTYRGTPVATSLSISLMEYDDKLPGTGSAAMAREAATRSTTGQGGPKRIPGSPAPSQTRDVTVKG